MPYTKLTLRSKVMSKKVKSVELTFENLDYDHNDHLIFRASVDSSPDFDAAVQEFYATS